MFKKTLGILALILTLSVVFTLQSKASTFANTDTRGGIERDAENRDFSGGGIERDTA